MKNLLVVTLLCFITSLLSAQNRLGFKLGYHISNMEFKTEGAEEGSASKGSFHAGVLYEIPFARKFYFQPALFILEKA